MVRNDEGSFPNEKKGIQRPIKISNVQKIHQSEDFWHGVCNFASIRGSGREEVAGAS